MSLVIKVTNRSYPKLIDQQSDRYKMLLRRRTVKASSSQSNRSFKSSSMISTLIPVLSVWVKRRCYMQNFDTTPERDLIAPGAQPGEDTDVSPAPWRDGVTSMGIPVVCFV
uniref:Uncharacterized protein n=1 Tax=Arundo donax TaxID=35708 RepID=A0A0A9CA50_ARUDO